MVQLADQRALLHRYTAAVRTQGPIPKALRTHVALTFLTRGNKRCVSVAAIYGLAARTIVGVVPMCKAQNVDGVFAVRRVRQIWIMQGSAFEGIGLWFELITTQWGQVCI